MRPARRFMSPQEGCHSPTSAHRCARCYCLEVVGVICRIQYIPCWPHRHRLQVMKQPEPRGEHPISLNASEFKAQLPNRNHVATESHRLCRNRTIAMVKHTTDTRPSRACSTPATPGPGKPPPIWPLRACETGLLAARRESRPASKAKHHHREEGMRGVSGHAPAPAPAPSLTTAGPRRPWPARPSRPRPHTRRARPKCHRRPRP